MEYLIVKDKNIAIFRLGLASSRYDMRSSGMPYHICALKQCCSYGVGQRSFFYQADFKTFFSLVRVVMADPAVTGFEWFFVFHIPAGFLFLRFSS